MLTGDNVTTARAVASQLGIGEIEARAARAQERGGAAVARGGPPRRHRTGVAMVCAGVTLLTGDLTGRVRGRRLSVATMPNIRQNGFALL